MTIRLRAATRGSRLALWQTNHVARLLGSAFTGDRRSTAASAVSAVSARLGDVGDAYEGIHAPQVTVEPVIVSTFGDRQAEIPIHEMGGKGVFVKEVQKAVLDGRADIAVHSAKDLPAETLAGLALAAIPKRGDPRDALVGCRLEELPVGATVATGSLRRRAQLAELRPDVLFAELRGNIPTRLERVNDYHAIFAAAAALERLGVVLEVLDILEPDVFLPQAGQGAIVVECRQDDHDSRALLSVIEHTPTRRTVDAERAFLAELGGDCNQPAGAYATIVDDSGVGSGLSDDAAKRLELTGLIASLDGQIVLRETRTGVDPMSLGREVARYLLDHAGGGKILNANRSRA